MHTVETKSNRRAAASTRTAVVRCVLLTGVLAGCSIGAPGTVTPVLTIMAITGTATEGTPLEFAVSADPTPTADLSINIRLDAAGCLLARSSDQTVTISAGEARVTLTVTTVGDTGADGCTVTAAIAPGDGYSVGASAASASVTLTRGDGDPDNPQAPEVTIAAVAATVEEGSPVSFTLTASAPSAEPLTVNVTWAETGSFLTGPRPSEVTIPAGSDTVTLSAITDDDNTAESNGSVIVGILDGGGYHVGAPNAAAVTVQDNDSATPLTSPEPGTPLAPEITIAAGPESVQEGSPLSFTLTASTPPAESLIVNIIWIETGSFLTGTRPSSVTIPAGSETATFTADTDNDVTDETNGSVTAAVLDGVAYTVGSPNATTVSVFDDDPEVTIAAAAESVQEGSPVSFTLTATAAPTKPEAVSVTWTETGSFLTGHRPSAVTIPAGSRTATLSANTAYDVTSASSGTVTVAVVADPGYRVGRPSAATVTVTLDRSPVSVAVSPATADVAVGNTLRLAAEAFDRRVVAVQGTTFAWSSSDTGVATVDNAGLVEGVAEGTATISAAAGPLRGSATIAVAAVGQGGGPPDTVPRALAYLTQAVQSRDGSVPLIGSERALLRVFVTTRTQTGLGIPRMRATFYLDGTQTHVADIPAQSTAIPTEIDEGSLSASGNVEIPASVVRPGLEMVVEIDPDRTIAAEHGLTTRIPETGRMAIGVTDFPTLKLTIIPFVNERRPDESVIDQARAMAADPYGHSLLSATRDLLPVRVIEATAHDTVWTNSPSISKQIDDTIAIRSLETGSGHYLAMMARYHFPPGYALRNATGGAMYPGWVLASLPDASSIAQHLGHNMNLDNAPCGVYGTDPLYPHRDGSIGSWGYDFTAGLVSPATKDLMSYCNPRWISPYHFTKAANYRVLAEGSAQAATPAAAADQDRRTLLLWGGVDPGGEPFLNPAFVVDAPPVLPDSAGEHRLIGRTADGRELFHLAFAMHNVAHPDGGSVFAFIIPTKPEWAGQLAIITLSGPAGSTTIDDDTDSPIAIHRDPASGQVRAILRQPASGTAGAIVGYRARAAASADLTGVSRQAGDDGLDVLFSRGIPDASVWNR